MKTITDEQYKSLQSLLKTQAKIWDNYDPYDVAGYGWLNEHPINGDGIQHHIDNPEERKKKPKFHCRDWKLNHKIRDAINHTHQDFKVLRSLIAV